MKCHLFNDCFEIAIDKQYYITFFEKIKMSGLNIYNVKFYEDNVSFIYSANDDLFISKLIESNRVKVISKVRKGYKKPFLNKKYITSYIIGIFIFAIIIKVFTFYIWNIKFEGNTTITENELQSCLKNFKIIPGVEKNNIDCNYIENKIRLEFPEISWVCAEIKGNNLIVHINEQYRKDMVEQIEGTYNLVSKSNSVIYSVVTRKGTPMVKKGDVVKPGDVLISGVVNITNEYDEKLKTYYTPPDGDVIGKTVYYYKKTIPLNNTEKEIYDIKNSYYVEIFGRDFGKKSNKTDNSYTVNVNRGVVFFGDYYFPVRIGVNKQYFFKEKTNTYSEKQAKELAIESFQFFLQSLVEKQMQICEKSVKIYVEKNQCITEGTITVLEPLSQVLSFEYVEEGTSIFNERN